MVDIRHGSVDTPTIDRRQLWALLRCYFRLSTRGRLSQSIGRGLIAVVATYALVGVMASTIVLGGEVDVFTFAVLMHSMTFFVVGMAVTAESGDILFNANESDVLVHRPIHPRTLLLAKAINLMAFTLLLGGALNLVPMFAGLAARDARLWFPVVHVLSIVVMCVFCAAAVVCAYGLVIRYFDREKFDNIATWSQVAMSIVFIAGYQVLPRLVQRFRGQSLGSHARYFWLMPPGWFAAIDAWAASHQTSGAMLPLALTGVAATAALAYAAIGRLAPSYGEGLTRLGESRSRNRAAGPAADSVLIQTADTLNPILGWWLRDPIERQVFRLTAVYMRRDRDIKLRLYPSLSMCIIFPLMGMFDSERPSLFSMVPLTTWMLGMVPLSALEALRLSSQFAAADLFVMAPLASAAPVFHGARKAVLYYLLAPATVISAALCALLAPAGRESLLLAIPGLIAIPAVSLLPGLTRPYLPLSSPAARGEQTARNVGLTFTTMLAMAGVLGVSFVVTNSGWLWQFVAVETAAVALLYWVFNRSIHKRPLRPDAGRTSKPGAVRQ